MSAIASGLEFAEDVSTPPVSLALLLFDSYTGDPVLFGTVDVSIAGQDAPLEKTTQSTFIFFDLPAGTYSVQVSSDEATPYYQPVTIPVTVPFPPVIDPVTGQPLFVWPAYPDISKADRTKAPDDPKQPLAYRQQRQLAGLVPTPQYPFPPGATLVQGVVLRGTLPVKGFVVSSPDTPDTYVTGNDGTFVLTFPSLTTQKNGSAVAVTSLTTTVTAQLGTQQTASASVNVQRGVTARTQLQLTP